MTPPRTCVWCGEPADTLVEACRQVTAIEADGTAALAYLHVDCAIRSAAGSLGHQRGRCSCHGGDEEDPPGVSRRAAARAAALLFRNGPVAGEELVAEYLARETGS